MTEMQSLDTHRLIQGPPQAVRKGRTARPQRLKKAEVEVKVKWYSYFLNLNLSLNLPYVLADFINSLPVRSNNTRQNRRTEAHGAAMQTGTPEQGS